MEPVFHARQGDVKVDVVDSLPPTAIPKAREDGLVVLAHGEVSGHKHHFTEGNVQMYTNDNRTFIVIEGAPATLYHEEHDPITFAPGVYEIRRQREWTDKQEPMPVLD
jgi:hypothetical protein